MIFYYFILINVLSFLLFMTDKRRAIKKNWRISEMTLLVSAFLGGSLGAMGGMYCLRHKTKHMKFIILVPLFLILHIILIIKFI